MGGRAFTWRSMPLQPSASHRVVGVRKPVTPRKVWSSSLLVLTSEMEALSGRSSALLVQPEPSTGLRIQARPRTLSSPVITSRLRVAETSARAWRGPGAQTRLATR